MKIKSLLIAVLSLSVLAGCQPSKEADIVTTLFPQYDFAKQIVGDKMSVSLLVPPGSEAHDYEPTSRDFDAIRNSQLFIFSAYDWDSWLGDNVNNFLASGTALNIFENIDIEQYESDHDDDHDNHDEDHEEHDDHDNHDDHDHSMHYWTNPKIAIQMIEAILKEVVKIDPTNAAFYTQNANDYIARIDELDHEMHEYFESVSSNLIYFAGHNAMDFFSERYHIEIKALTDGFQPDADVTSAQLEQMLNGIKDNQIKFLFVEELKEPKVANTIKNELAKENYEITILELHGYHNVTRTQLNDDLTYFDLMKQNFDNLKMAVKP
jgi:zinc transport system substrate-binding protein